VLGARDIGHLCFAHSFATVEVLKVATSSTSRLDKRTIRASIPPNIAASLLSVAGQTAAASQPIPTNEVEPSQDQKCRCALNWPKSGRTR